MTVTASASMFRVNALKLSGDVWEDFFSDHIDTGSSLRARASCFRIPVVSDAVLHHALGGRKAYRVAGTTMKLSTHPAERRYFIFHNRIRVLRAYDVRLPAFVLFNLVLICCDILNILLFENDKAGKLKMMGKGFVDGLSSAQGRR